MSVPDSGVFALDTEITPSTDVAFDFGYTMALPSSAGSNAASHTVHVIVVFAVASWLIEFSQQLQCSRIAMYKSVHS